MYCSIHKTKMTQLFTSFVCDLCSPPGGQPVNQTIPQLTQPSSVVPCHPCTKMNVTFIVDMQDAVGLEYKRRRLGFRPSLTDIIILIGRDVWDEWIASADIVSAHKPTTVAAFSMLTNGLTGQLNHSPTFTDAYLNDVLLDPRDIFMLVDMKFSVMEWLAGNAIVNATKNGRVVLHSRLV